MNKSSSKLFSGYFVEYFPHFHRSQQGNGWNLHFDLDPFILGFGVFAKEEIAANSFLCAYTGTVLLETDFEREVSEGKRVERVGYIYTVTSRGKTYW